MATTIAKTLIASILLSLLVLQQQVRADDQPGVGGSGTTSSTIEDGKSQAMDCGAACVARCSLSSRPNLCKRACGTCCNRCQCVPPGTAGNYDVCPCYAAQTTRGGRPKCP